jgi:hypothetical protein
LIVLAVIEILVFLSALMAKGSYEKKTFPRDEIKSRTESIDAFFASIVILLSSMELFSICPRAILYEKMETNKSNTKTGLTLKYLN